LLEVAGIIPQCLTTAIFFFRFLCCSESISSSSVFPAAFTQIQQLPSLCNPPPLWRRCLPPKESPPLNQNPPYNPREEEGNPSPAVKKTPPFGPTEIGNLAFPPFCDSCSSSPPPQRVHKSSLLSPSPLPLFKNLTYPVFLQRFPFPQTTFCVRCRNPPLTHFPSSRSCTPPDIVNFFSPTSIGFLIGPPRLFCRLCLPLHEENSSPPSCFSHFPQLILTLFPKYPPSHERCKTGFFLFLAGLAAPQD